MVFETTIGLRSFDLEQFAIFTFFNLYSYGYRFGKDLVDLEGPIPAHLLGSMWADSWANLGSTVNPYPGNPTTNVTSAMRKQKWSEKTMFEKEWFPILESAFG